MTLSEVITGEALKRNVYHFSLSSDNDCITFKFVRVGLPVSEMRLSRLWLLFELTGIAIELGQ